MIHLIGNLLRHQVLRSSAKVLVWSGIAVLFNGLSGVLSARALAVSDKGILALVLTIGGLLYVLTSVGTNVAFRVDLPKGDGRVNVVDYRRVSLALLPFHVVATIVMISIAQRWIDGWKLGIGFVSSVLLLSLLVFCCNQVLDALHAFGLSSTATRSDAIGSVVTAGLLTVWIISPAHPEGLTWIIGCYVFGYVVRLSVATFHLAREHRRRPTVKATLKGSRRLLSSGRGFLGYNVGQTVAFRADRYLLGVIVNPTALGIYSVASTPAEMLRLPVTALSQIMMQRVARFGLTSRLVRHACLATAAVTLPLAGALLVLARPIMDVLFGPRYSDSVPVLRVMVLSEIIVAFFLILVRMAAGAGLTRATGFATAGGAAVGLIALLALAPSYGAIGAAWASFFGYLVMACICAAAVIRAVQPIQASEGVLR